MQTYERIRTTFAEYKSSVTMINLAEKTPAGKRLANGDDEPTQRKFRKLGGGPTPESIDLGDADEPESQLP